MGTKPFKKYEEQLDIMKKRGLIIKDDEIVLKKLKRENYYNIINGYKDFFLDEQATLSKCEDVFEKGTTFEDISTLYDFDTEIRLLFLKNILKIENIFKTKISYFFEKKYTTQDFNYLNINNYNDAKKEDAARVIAEISNVIKNSLSQNYSGGKQIQHYINIHKNLPLWVLSKQLTFGNISYLYSSLEKDIQKEICNEIAEEFEKEYEKSVIIDEKNMEQIIKFINAIRNMCAHNDRIYNVLIRKNGNIPKIQHSHLNNIFNSRIFDVLIILKLFITKEEFYTLLTELEKNLKNLEKLYNSNVFGKILNETGIPKNWKNIVGDVLFWEKIYETTLSLEGKQQIIHIYIESGNKIEKEVTINDIIEKYENSKIERFLCIHNINTDSYYFELKILKIFNRKKEELKTFSYNFCDEKKKFFEEKKESNFKEIPSEKFEKIAESFKITPYDLKKILILISERELKTVIDICQNDNNC